MASVAIIGGGVVGLACGIALARAGEKVTLIEAEAGEDAASWGNAGHIAVEQVTPLASIATLRSAPARLFSRGGALALPPTQWRAWLPFGARMALAARPARFAHGKAALTVLMADALPAWRRLADTLPDRELLREDGHIVAWESAASAAAGRRAWAGAETGTATFADTDVALPGSPAGAIRFSGTAQIADPLRLAKALRSAFAAAGGRAVAGGATIDRGGVRIDGVPFVTERVVVCAGVRSGAVLRPMGHRVPILAERGYHLRSADHDWPANLPPVIYEDRSLIVTRYDRDVQVASFVEPGFADAAPDPAKWDRLERHIAELKLPIRGPFARWMGARPTLPDYLPAIGRSSRAPDIFYAFGHQHLGLTLAATTGEIVATMMTGATSPIDLAPFDLGRFGWRRVVPSGAANDRELPQP